MEKTTTNYVDNKEFLKAIIQYRRDCRAAKKTAKEKKRPTVYVKPRIPDYIGQCILLIAENMAHKSWFNQYTYKDEMIGDGIENCVRYFDNFDPKVSTNPFAYFSQIIYFAFRRRIIRERNQLYAKYKMTEQMGILGEFDQVEGDDGVAAQQFELHENIADFIGAFESAQRAKKKKAKKRRLERFMAEEAAA